MSLLDHTQHRVKAFISEIDRLTESEFPYWHSRAALSQLGALLAERLKRLEGFTAQSNPAVVAQECRVTLQALFSYLPILGFVLRSTNIRNAFEVFGPFLGLAGDLLEPGIDRKARKTKLLLSSEWNYSPFTYRPIRDLPDFVLIGVPAPESSNPLLTPLAGHELGHSVWAKYDLAKSFQADIESQIVAAIISRWSRYQLLFGSHIKQATLTTDLFARETWRLAAEWALRQTEETFCDLLGLRLFGAAYLQAFAYILSPGFASRSAEYPAIVNRVTNLTTAAGSFGIAAPPSFISQFEPEVPPNLSPVDELRLAVADVALAAVVPAIAAQVNQRVADAKTVLPNVSESQRVYERLKLMIPAEGCRCMADILNGAWLAFDDSEIWADHPAVAERRFLVLKELVLKNLELFEIERIQAQP